MANDQSPEVRYATRSGALLKQDVEVVLTKRAEGRWGLAHCAEKGQRCTGHQCPIRLPDAPASLEAIWW